MCRGTRQQLSGGSIRAILRRAKAMIMILRVRRRTSQSSDCLPIPAGEWVYPDVVVVKPSLCICYVESEGAGGSEQLCEDDAVYGLPLPKPKDVSIFSGILCCTLCGRINAGDRY